MTNVVVYQPIGSCSFACCTADVFAAGVLTISGEDAAHPVREFQPLYWTEATVYGAGGYPEFRFINPGAEQAMEHMRAMRQAVRDRKDIHDEGSRHIA